MSSLWPQPVSALRHEMHYDVYYYAVMLGRGPTMTRARQPPKAGLPGGEGRVVSGVHVLFSFFLWRHTSASISFLPGAGGLHQSSRIGCNATRRTWTIMHSVHRRYSCSQAAERDAASALELLVASDKWSILDKMNRSALSMIFVRFVPAVKLICILCWKEK